MITSYINNKGKTVVIAEMVDAYLLNSYAYYNNRCKLIKEKGNSPFTDGYYNELSERVAALKAEIDKRKLLETP